MNYKLMQEYQDMLDMGYVDITNIYKSSKPIIAFQHKSQVGRESKQGDIRYVIQQSGYGRNPNYYDYQGSKGWNANGRILDTFQADLPNFREVCLVLLATNLKIANGLIDKNSAYKIRAQIKIKGIIKNLFESNETYYNRAFMAALKGANNNYKKAFDMINDPKKIYQGIVRLAKELGI